MEISELFPHIGSKADEIALIRSCYGEAFDHAPAIYLRNTGSQFPGQSVPRIVGRVRAGFGEPESAGIRSDVRTARRSPAAGVLVPAFCRRSTRARCSAADQFRC